jgi:pilus assembly protein CpaF
VFKEVKKHYKESKIMAIGSNGDLAKLKFQVADRLDSLYHEQIVAGTGNGALKQKVREKAFLALQKSGVGMPASDTEKIVNEIVDDVFGFGPIEAVLKDPNVTEVMVNGPNQVYVEVRGKLILANIRFDDDDHVERVINKIVKPLGRQANAKSPLVDARLPDGSRVNAVVRPCSIDGPSITIRKFSKDKLGVADLIKYNSLTEDMAKFLEACVGSRLNVVVSGGTGSGKTTLLNILSSFIPDEERIVTIEDAAELSLQQSHVVRLETKQPVDDKDTSVTIRDLVKNSLRMRPERIIIGECRGGEALDMLQAMNTGHDGSLTTVHSNSPRDAISRLETLVLMSGMELPINVVRKQISSAVHLIVQQSRLRDGSRKVMQITEVLGMEGENVVMQDVFKFEDEGDGADGKVSGQFSPTGLRPQYEKTLKVYGYNLPSTMFMPNRGNDSSLRSRRR